MTIEDEACQILRMAGATEEEAGRTVRASIVSSLAFGKSREEAVRIARLSVVTTLEWATGVALEVTRWR
jgi:hydroxymethylpyrimidine/phosphomethylpyrimidine kinase